MSNTAVFWPAQSINWFVLRHESTFCGRTSIDLVGRLCLRRACRSNASLTLEGRGKSVSRKELRRRPCLPINVDFHSRAGRGEVVVASAQRQRVGRPPRGEHGGECCLTSST